MFCTLKNAKPYMSFTIPSKAQKQSLEKNHNTATADKISKILSVTFLLGL